jgi:hypothetical protein
VVGSALALILTQGRAALAQGGTAQTPPQNPPPAMPAPAIMPSPTHAPGVSGPPVSSGDVYTTPEQPTPYAPPDITVPPQPQPNLFAPTTQTSDGYLRTQAYGNNLLPITPTIGEKNDYLCQGVCPTSYSTTLLGVLGRKRPDYEAKGLPLGGFRLFPTLDLAVAGTDNVYYTPSPSQSDAYFTIAPRLDLQSQWSQNALELFGGLQEKKFTSLSSEDQTDWGTGGAGRLDILRGVDLYLKTDYEAQHEPRYSPDSPGRAAAPTPFQTETLNLRGDYQVAGLGLQLGGTYQDYDYDSTSLIDAAPLSNDDRNRNNYTGFGKASYQLSPDYSLYVQGSYEDRAYDLHVDRYGFDRNSTGYILNAGSKFTLSNLIDGDVFAGYEQELYHGLLPNVGGLDFGGDIHWYATELITVNLIASHDIVDTVLRGESASNNQTVTLDVDYELLRNLILQAAFTYVNSRYVGVDPFTLDTKTVDFGASYLINHYLSANVHYSFNGRTATVPSDIYNNNVLSIGLTGQL